jgi:uncharacterized protein YyaL (SSP411 family)
MSCGGAKETVTDNVKKEIEHTNELANESSPYLLQHQHNPVNWVAWDESVFERAKKEDKLVLISIGYSACHWCHVMEKESFENEEVAKLMNDNFICIKVDREERPDVDQVYMNAVQLMTKRGGWPLNCITLPDGRPVFGGTYFPKDQWMDVLKQIQSSFENDRTKFEEYAKRLHEGIQMSELIIEPSKNVDFKKEKLIETMIEWKKSFDKKEGGNTRAPKFPIPNNYEFMMRYAHQFNDDEVAVHVENTMNKMARGGIYDQIGGGFARYSTDLLWKVPHFEKMLYDNAQMMSLYSQGYVWNQSDLYKHTVYQIDEWLEREMSLKNGAFYAALDADSEGEEGKFYVWSKDELKEILSEEDYDFVKEVYNVNNKGYWEHDNYILLRDKSFEELTKLRHLSRKEFDDKYRSANQQLLKVRDKRIHPGLDDKSLTAWNALMIKGYVDAYKAFGDKLFLQRALKGANWLHKQQTQSNGKLWHTYKNDESKIDGFLEDYAAVIQAYLAIYEITFDEEWFQKADGLAKTTIREFFDPKSGMFWFTDQDSKLVARKMELSDNVIPASNSIMARNLYLLSKLKDDKNYETKSKQMLKNIYGNIHTYGAGYSNWGQLLLEQVDSKREIVIVGEQALEIRKELAKHYLPNHLIIGSEKASDSPMFKDRYRAGKTMIYVCENNTCQLPVETVEEALKLIQK